MTAMLRLHLGDSAAAATSVALFPTDGEFARAWRGLRERGIVVPMPVMLELYCYEFLERLREVHERDPGAEVHAPFHPLLAFAAGDVLAHPGEVLVAMWPLLRISWRPSDAARTAECATSLFAGQPFDPERYVALLAEHAAAQGWSRT